MTKPPAAQVTCRQCGEEVLGAVNRCWKCNSPLDARHYPIPAPRRQPLPNVRPTSSPFAPVANAAELEPRVSEDADRPADPSTVSPELASLGITSRGSHVVVTVCVVLIAATVLGLIRWPGVSLLTALAAVGLAATQLRTSLFPAACFLLAIACLLLGTTTALILFTR